MKSTVHSSKENKGIVIFVHGAWHGAWCWKKYFVKQFENRGYECHTFNLPRHDTPGPVKGINSLSIKDYADALKREINKLDEPPIIIGHSMGGMIVQKYLETSSCKKAVLMASAPVHGLLRTTLRFMTKNYGLASLLSFDLYRMVNTPAKARFAFFSDAMPEEDVQEYADKLCGESYRAFVDMLYPRVKVNHHVKIPLLVIGAKNDNIFSERDNERTAAKYGADLIMIDDIAHDMMIDVNHEKVSESILNWIEG